MSFTDNHLKRKFGQIKNELEKENIGNKTQTEEEFIECYTCNKKMLHCDLTKCWKCRTLSCKKTCFSEYDMYVR